MPHLRSARRRPVTAPADNAQFAELARRVNNWGRWGPDDERGTLNLLTPSHVRDAAALVRDGRQIALALPLSEDGPQLGFVRGRTNPTRTMVAVHEPLGDAGEGVRFNDDAVQMGLQAATHWDALAHVSYGGRVENGGAAAGGGEAAGRPPPG